MEIIYEKSGVKIYMKEDAIDTTFVVANRKREEIRLARDSNPQKKMSLSWMRQLQFTTVVL